MKSNMVVGLEIPYATARQIMGKNFLGPDEIIRFLGVQKTEGVMDAFKTLPSEEILFACRNTHILVADFGISLVDFRNLIRKYWLFYKYDWYFAYHWAKDSEEPQWRLILKGAVPNSFSRGWHGQQKLLTDEEVVPRARRLVYLVLLNYLVNKETLFEKTYVRSSDVSSIGNHILIGNFGSPGNLNKLHIIGALYSVLESREIGLASERKF